MPNWLLAQPFRMLAHNGEINTLQGNRNWMRAREASLASPLWSGDRDLLKPVIWEAGSDSASLDNALELIEQSGPRRPARDDDARARGLGEHAGHGPGAARPSTSTTPA